VPPQRHGSEFSLSHLLVYGIFYDTDVKSDAQWRAIAMVSPICTRAIVTLWDWMQTWLQRNNMGRKKSKRSRKDSSERPQSIARGNETVKPQSVQSEAELYKEALARLRDAEARKDLAEVVRLAEALRTRFPHGPDGYKIGAKALRDSKRFDEIDLLLREATIRFPDEAWPLVETGWSAIARGDREKAIQCAEQLRARFPANPAGYRIAAVSLRESRRFDEVEMLLRDAMARFPSEDWPLVESAWAAHGSGDWEQTVHRAEILRARVPMHPAGYRLGVHALRRTKRVDEATTLLREAEARFPEAAWISAVE
jgi:tetratricopeptide (TPR) repeat protein